MGTFPTYGMAGIGIAAAIGFVFALSFLGNNGAINDGEILQSNEPTEQQRTSEPLADQESGDDASTAAKDSGGEMESAPAGETAMMLTDLRPTLTSIVALDSSREVIVETKPDMEFKVGEPVLIQASFANENPDVISDHFIAMSIRNAGASETLSQADESFEPAANFQGNIAANSSIALELYWTPQRAGNYTLLLFSVTPDDLTSTVPVQPAAIIPIRVLE